MKKITYTNMRSELSEILELLRSGESVTITQRGKPDVTIKKSNNIRINNRNANSDIDFYIGYSQELVTHTNKVKKCLVHKVAMPSMKRVNFSEPESKISSASETFKAALSHTQIKHADIIKKLEDK